MFRDFCEKINFPNEAIEYFESLLPVINKSKNTVDKIKTASDLLCNNDHPSAQEIVKEISNDLGIHEYTIWIYVLIDSAIKAHDLYKKKNIPDDIYYDNMKDITYKLIECKNVHNVWGNFVAYWYCRFFICDRFSLGRLQFETRPCPADYKGYAKKDEMIYGCHIPSSGPLVYEDVIDSLKKAYEFFNIKKGEYLIVNCHSWLIYPPLVNLFKDGSNVRKFYNLFEIINTHESKLEIDGWRIFNTFDLADINALPEKTSLQKSVKKYLQDGNNMGSGIGMIVFDGEKVVNK